MLFQPTKCFLPSALSSTVGSPSNTVGSLPYDSKQVELTFERDQNKAKRTVKFMAVDFHLVARCLAFQNPYYFNK